MTARITPEGFLWLCEEARLAGCSSARIGMLMAESLWQIDRDLRQARLPAVEILPRHMGKYDCNGNPTQPAHSTFIRIPDEYLIEDADR